MLPGSDAVKAVYLDPQTGVLAGAVAAAEAVDTNSTAPQQKLIMESGTIETDTILSVAKAAQETSTAKQSDSHTKENTTKTDRPKDAQANTQTNKEGCASSASSRVFPVVKSYLQH